MGHTYSSLSSLGRDSGIRQPIKQKNHSLWLKFLDIDSDALWKDLSQKLEPDQDFKVTHSLMKDLDKKLHIGMDSYEQYSFALMLHALMGVQRFRFGGKIYTHHPLDFRNTTADHSVSVCVNEIIPLFKRIAEDMAADDTPMQPVAEAFRAAIVRTLMHDMGETIMEFHSYAEESAKNSEDKKEEQEDQIKLEAEISEFFLKLALYSSLDERSEVFIDTLATVREQIVDQDLQRSKFGYKETAERLRHFFESYNFKSVFPGFEHEETALNDRLGHYMKYYSHAEDFRGVGGPAVKIAQIIDGNVTFLIHAERGMRDENSDVVPYAAANNNQILGAYRRSESHLKRLFTSAVDGQLMESMARHIAKRNYETLIWHICMGPSVLHRPKPGAAKSEYNETIKGRGDYSLYKSRLEELQQIQDIESRARTDFRKAAPSLLKRDTISARTQFLLYAAAYCNDSHMDDLSMYDEPLAYQRRIHDNLIPYVQVLDYIESNGLDLNDSDHINTVRQEFLYKHDARYPDVISNIRRNTDKVNQFMAWYNDWQKDISPKLLNAAL